MSNKYVKSLLDQAEERFSVDSKNMSMTEWCGRNTSLRNRPFSVKGYEFQRAILDDMHPNMDVIKISQVGLTELQIRKALAFLKRNDGSSLIFTLPNEDMYKRVSNSRVKPIINKDKVFNTPQDKENKAVRSVDMMQFGQSFMYLAPVLEASATSIPADVVLNDEVDLSDQQIIALFASRMQNSKFKIWQRFSTPTFPSFGIDLNWQTSDQHLYMVKCDSCGEWSHPEFSEEFIHLEGRPDKKLLEITENFKEQIDFGNSYIKCPSCHAALDLKNPDLRQWAAKYPSRVNSRGYRVGPFATGNLDLRYIYESFWRYQKNEYVRGFHNTVLGMPYSDGSMQIPEADILACMTNQTDAPAFSKFDDIWVGIDMGQTCHITIGRGSNKDKLEILSMYTVHVDEIVTHCKDLYEKYNIRGGAVDRHPYEPTADEIFRVTSGRIVPVEYRGQKDLNLVYDQYDKVAYAQVNHTWFLDNFAGKIRKRDLPISGYGYQKRILVEHFRDMIRDEKPGEPAKWIKLTKNDHYLHSGAFMCVAPYIAELIRLKSDEEIRTMAISQVVQTKDGAANLIGTTGKPQKKFVESRLI